MNIEVLTFDNLPQWNQKFKILQQQIATSSDKLKDNYHYNRLILDQQEFSTIVLIENEIAAFSFLYSRKEWHKVSRILSRYYIVPKYRKNHFNFRNKFTNLMLDKQMEFAKNNNKDFVFTSREFPSWAWLNSIIDNPSNRFKWETNRNNLYQTCPNNSAECWQHVAWHKINILVNEFSLPSKEISNYKNE